MLVRQAGRMEVKVETDRGGCGADWRQGFETRPMNVTFCFPQHYGSNWGMVGRGIAEEKW